MLNFKRKRVLNPILMLKSIILSVFIGAFTVVTSLPVDASFASQLDKIFKNDPPNEEQISLKEELKIMRGKDDRDRSYLHNYFSRRFTDSEEEEDDYEPSERSMMLEYIPQVDILPTEEFTRANKICKAYDDAMLEAKNRKYLIDFCTDKEAPKTKKEYKDQIKRLSSFSSLYPEIKSYKETKTSEDEQKVFSSTLRSEVQDHMLAQLKEAKHNARWLGDLEKSRFVLTKKNRGVDIPRIEVEFFENERNEQSDNQNNKQHNEQSNKQLSKRGDLCPGLLSKCNVC